MNSKIRNFIMYVGYGLIQGAVFLCPYIIYSYYVTFQEATGYSNIQIGTLISVYGAVGLPMNFLGGVLSDRFETKKLVVLGAFASGLVGFGMAALPSYPMMLCLYALHTFTCTGLYYGAALKMKRLLGTAEEQKKINVITAYATTGCSLITSAIGIGLVAIFPTPQMVVRTLMSMWSVITIIGGVIMLFTFQPKIEDEAQSAPPKKEDYIAAFKNKYVWFLGFTGFLVFLNSDSLTYLQPYLVESCGVSPTISAALGVVTKNISLIALPLVAMISGKKRSVSKTMNLLIAVAIALMAFFAFVPMNAGNLVICIVLFIVVAILISGAQGSLYVPLSEMDIPVRIFGVVCGIITTVTYSVDIFYFSLFGSLIDKMGLKAYQIIFGVSAVCLALACLLMLPVTKRVDHVMEKQHDQS